DENLGFDPKEVPDCVRELWDGTNPSNPTQATEHSGPLFSCGMKTRHPNRNRTWIPLLVHSLPQCRSRATATTRQPDISLSRIPIYFCSVHPSPDRIAGII